MLKNVVFPAPFGPIRLTIPPLGTSKSMSLHATSPPNSLRTPRASRIGSVGAASLMLHHRMPDAHAELRGPELGPFAPARYETLRAQQHHQHDHRPEDPVGVGRNIEAGAERGVERFAD